MHGLTELAQSLQFALAYGFAREPELVGDVAEGLGVLAVQAETLGTSMLRSLSLSWSRSQLQSALSSSELTKLSSAAIRVAEGGLRAVFPHGSLEGDRVLSQSQDGA